MSSLPLLIPPFLLLFSLHPLLPIPSGASQRLCEVQGTCLSCGGGHFSHFICRSDGDCFPGEFCVPSRGFCCPLRQHSASPLMKGEEGEAGGKCPDGSGWQRMCKQDGDCLFRDELCARGKCCPSCKQRRLQALRESAGGEWTDRPPGLSIPQCTDDGRFHRPMQCAGGSSDCYCVDKFGRIIAPRKKEAPEGKEKLLNCSRLREQMEGEEEVEKEEEGKKKRSDEKDENEVGGRSGKSQRVLALTNRDSGGGGGGRGDATEASSSPSAPSSSTGDEAAASSCADSLRVFRRCGSACPISCATRTAPRCPQEQCLRGCFCQLPYVILEASDPFGSRCVLPAECPLLPFTPELNSWHGGFFPAAAAAASVALEAPKRAEKCADPRKNFQTCGSACPAACGRLQEADGSCAMQCVSGCFCRVPFVLRDPAAPNSECVLPQQCPPPLPPLPTASYAAVLLPPIHAPPPDPRQLCPSAENKTWTSCFSQKCARSCADASSSSARCVPDDCVSGCECASPALVLDKTETAWHCVLPEDCHRQHQRGCDDLRKEFLTCGTSCPLGCDRLDQPERTCSPCAAGCFCRNGFVFANASDWRHSDCVPVSECPAAGNAISSSPSAVATTIVAFQQPSNDPEEGRHCPSAPLLLQRGSSPSCENDADCGMERKCCPSSPSSSAFGRRCVCSDPNARWSECGPLCPEFCAQPGPHLCPGPCRPGCYCPPGFVKRTSEPSSECVPMGHCSTKEDNPPLHGESQDDHRLRAAMVASLDMAAALKESASVSGNCGEALASATLYGRSGQRLGRLVVRPERREGAKSRRIRMSGEFGGVEGVPRGVRELLLSVHQFSETTSEGCAGVGAPLVLRVLEEDDDNEGGDMFKKVTAASTELRAPRRRTQREEEVNAPRVVFGMDLSVEWADPVPRGTNPLIGHSIVLKAPSSSTTTGDDAQRTVLGCAVLGIAPSC